MNKIIVATTVVANKINDIKSALSQCPLLTYVDVGSNVLDIYWKNETFPRYRLTLVNGAEDTVNAYSTPTALHANPQVINLMATTTTPVTRIYYNNNFLYFSIGFNDASTSPAWLTMVFLEDPISGIVVHQWTTGAAITNQSRGCGPQLLGIDLGQKVASEPAGITIDASFRGKTADNKLVLLPYTFKLPNRYYNGLFSGVIEDVFHMVLSNPVEANITTYFKPGMRLKFDGVPYLCIAKERIAKIIL